MRDASGLAAACAILALIIGLAGIVMPEEITDYINQTTFDAHVTDFDSHVTDFDAHVTEYDAHNHYVYKQQWSKEELNNVKNETAGNWTTIITTSMEAGYVGQIYFIFFTHEFRHSVNNINSSIRFQYWMDAPFNTWTDIVEYQQYTYRANEWDSRTWCLVKPCIYRGDTGFRVQMRSDGTFQVDSDNRFLGAHSYQLGGNIP